MKMRIEQFIQIALCFLLLNVTSCEKDKDSNALPAETHEGYGTFGCYINNKIWTSNALYFSSGAFANKMNLSISASPRSDQNLDVGIVIKNTIIKTDTVYSLTTFSHSHGYYQVDLKTSSTCYYITSNESIGSLILTKFDTINRIVSGRFSFRAQLNDTISHNNEMCDTSTLNVTEGRFDLKYTKE